MKRVCYWCGKYMGEKVGSEGGIFHSVCDECSKKLNLEERLPELLKAIALLRKQSGVKE